MSRLAIGLALLVLAALLAAVGYVLARPKWRWEPEDEPWDTGSPPSVTSRMDNGTAWSAIVDSPDDAARWAGG